MQRVEQRERFGKVFYVIMLCKREGAFAERMIAVYAK